MVRTSKQTVPASAAAAAPVAASTKLTSSSSETASASASAGTKKAASAGAKEAAVVPAVTIEVTDSSAAPVVVPEEVVGEDLVEMLTAFGNKINQGYAFFATLKTQFKTLQKSVLKAHKTAQKVSNRKNRRSGNRKPSGFVRPALISDELAIFLGKPVGTEMARTDVSKEINNYIRTNKLQDEKNGRQINADAKLTTLLKLESVDNLTYFNLQRYMKHHFVKIEVPAVVAPEVVVA